MITNSSEKELLSKQEGEKNKETNKATITTSSSRSWSGLKDPRIVRVSRLFGGKDRHSKVSTVRGLRDRRVRLSVPTAIQLYDLQDRLGLNQPSKVVDWLLKAAEHDIDKLPPLQIPPAANFLHFPRSSSLLSSSIPPPPPNASHDHHHHHQPQLQTQPQSQSTHLLSASKSGDELIEGNEVEVIDHNRVFRPIQPSFSSLLHNPSPYNTSYYHYDPSVALASHSSSNQDEVSRIPSPYMMPSLLTSYAISQNEFCNKDSSHFQIPSSTTTTTTTPTKATTSSEGHLIRTSPHSASYPMTYFHSNLAPKHS